MARHVILGLAAAFAMPQGAEARAISATLTPPDDATHGAVHLPTGCRAEIVLSGQTLVRAQITDPDCLPKGVKARRVPGALFDFMVTPK